MKSDGARRGPTDERILQATYWYVERTLQTQWSPVKEEQFRKWLEDPQNRAMYAKCDHVAQLLRDHCEPTVCGGVGPATQSRVDGARARATSHFLRPFANWLRSAAGYPIGAVMILGLAVVAAGALPFLLAEYWSTDYQTGPGEYLTISLEDRSRIELSGSTRVTVYFSALRRSVVLKQGEALFRVTHNSRHPFQVDVERARVTDLGTTFDVRRDSDGQVVVAVVEGTILVTTHQRTGAANVSASTRMGSNDHSAGIRVKAGEAVNMKPTGEVGPLHSVNVQEVTAWSGGVYAYRDTLLADVIADMQLHSARRIEYEPDAGKLVYTGLTDQNEPEVWVHGLPNILPVEVEDSDPDRLLIRCRSAGCKSR